MTTPEVQAIKILEKDWKETPRWKGICRPYTASDVVRLRGTLPIEYTLAKQGAEKLWKHFHTEPFVSALGASTGNQAVQQVKAGLKSVYVSGWQVAADANEAGEMYPDQSLYPANSVPQVIQKINNALMRADQLTHAEGNHEVDWFVPIVADAEAGFGGVLNAFELMKAMIKSGAAGVHFEDQLASAKKCGHMGGKVLVTTGEAISKLIAARLAADVCGIATVLIARTDAQSANLMTSNSDERDHLFCTSTRTHEGYYKVTSGIKQAIQRGLAFAPYADVVWCESGTPDLKQAKEFSEAIQSAYPGKILAYNCSPSFNWKKHLSDAVIAKFQSELSALNYKYQFVTLAGFHTINYSMYNLARNYREKGMPAYVEFQQKEFQEEVHGYTATRHQREVGTAYFDKVAEAIQGKECSTTALQGSTEAAQF
ncbi:MAG: isocitrate lyase [Gammaproteobacteria bacterium]|nr:isocitrate lyase [Gammaproteobacteria bacterium]